MASVYNSQIEDSSGNVYLPRTDMIQTMEELKANTKAGKAADAMLLKEVNHNLNAKLAQGRVQLVIQSDGTLGYKLDGADTVHPFHSKLTIPTMGGGI